MVDPVAVEAEEIAVEDGPDEYEIRFDALALAIETVEPDISPATTDALIERADAFARWLRDGAE